LRRDAEPQIAEVDSLVIGPEDGGLRAAFVGDIEGTPYDVDGVIEDLQALLRFEGSPTTITASIGRNYVEGRGTVTRIWPFEAELNISGNAENVARLAELMGSALPGAGQGRLSGRLSIVERRAEMSFTSFEVYHNGANGEDPAVAIGPANGTLTIVRTNGSQFDVNGSMAANFVRVDPLFASFEETSRQSVAEVIETPIETGLPFAQRSIPYRQVARLTGAFRLEVTELHYRDAVFTDVVVPLSDNSGVLRIDDARAHYNGQPLALSFTADAADQSVRIEVDAHQIALGSLTEDLGGNSFVHGPALVAIRGEGQGATVGEVLQSFSGQSNLMIGQGRLERGGIDFLAADLLQSFFQAASGGYTPLVCLINRVDFENGVGTSRAFLMDTNLITVTGQGRVNLARNNIDFRLAPRPKDPTLLSLAADYKVEGPILSPTIMPEPGGIIRGVATTLGSLALTGGAAALLPLIASGSEDDLINPCIAAITGQEAPAQ